jgi:hypothetical protein
MIDENVAENLPGKNVKTVISIVSKHDEGHDEALDWARFPFPDDLPLPVKFNVTLQRDLAKLPRDPTTGFHGLDHNSDQTPVIC